MPAAIELMDALAIEAAEAAVHCNYPPGAGAVLLVELDGPAADVDGNSEKVERCCQDHGAFEMRGGRSPATGSVLERTKVRVCCSGPDQP